MITHCVSLRHTLLAAVAVIASIALGCAILTIPDGHAAVREPYVGGNNVTTGGNSLIRNTTGSNNIAQGYTSLKANTSGSANVAMGTGALEENLTGHANTAVGTIALRGNQTGAGNTAIGGLSLACNVSGSNNTALGFQAGMNCDPRSQNNVAIGYQSGLSMSGSDNIYLGSRGRNRESNTIRIGDPKTHSNTFIAGVITGDGSGLTHLNANAMTGGLTTNVVVTLSGGGTATLSFVNGILRAVE